MCSVAAPHLQSSAAFSPSSSFLAGFFVLGAMRELKLIREFFFAFSNTRTGRLDLLFQGSSLLHTDELGVACVGAEVCVTETR